MTLIDYLGRVHFADGVLEEALWSELTRNGTRRALVVSDSGHLQGDNAERFFAGLPVRVNVEIYQDIPPLPTEAAARDLAHAFVQGDRDLIIAFGHGAAIDLAKAARVALAHEQAFDLLSYDRGGERKIAGHLRDLYVVPGLAGVGAAVRPYTAVATGGGNRTLLMSRALIPSIAIFDPTLTLGADPAASASAGVEAIANCMEAFLAHGYNPPAEGIALDGLRRAIANLYEVLADDQLAARREMMAAGLNGSLAHQRGPGVSEVIANALESVTGNGLDHGSLSRLMLPGVLRLSDGVSEVKSELLHYLLPAGDDRPLAERVEAFLADLPLPQSLSRMGIDGDHVREAAKLASRELAASPYGRGASSDTLRNLMDAVM